MIQVRKIEHGPEKVLLGYFERAIKELGLGAWLAMLRPGHEEYFRKKVEGRVYSALEFQPWRGTRQIILGEPEKYLRWEPWDDPEEEIWAHYRLQSAVMATLMGDKEGILSLGAQLVIEPMNRKLEVSYFLGNLTGGRIGTIYKELPTKTQILQWVEEIGAVQLADRLPEIARIKYE